MTTQVLQGRYEIFKQLGQGGMGTVFLAKDLRLSHRLCVVKKLRVDFFREEDRQQALAFFQREAMVLSSLKHPHIVVIGDYFEEGGSYFLVMEYVEGENLQRKLLDQDEPFPESSVRDWAIKICDVLNYLHTHRPPVIYRDLKPSNIMVDSTGNIKLVDFGIARPYAEDADNTHVVSGGYSPPEQYWGGADPRSDLYGLGATMHFLLTGEEPLALQTSSPKEVNAKISNQMDKIVQKATAQDVWVRYQSAEAMLADLKNRVGKPSFQISGKALGLGVAIIFGALVIGGLNFLDRQDQLVNKESQPQAQPRTDMDSPEVPVKEHNRTKRLKKAEQREREPFVGSVTSSLGRTTGLAPDLANSNQLGFGRAGDPDRQDSSRTPYPLDSAFAESRESVISDPEKIETPDASADRSADKTF
jgi:serine/threonine protein kinase